MALTLFLEGFDDCPPLECPDCGGTMPLRPKPPAWGVGFVYLCDRYPDCRGLMSAHPNGHPMGVPVRAEVRRARRECHAMFDPLWNEAERLYTIRERSPGGRRHAIKRIRQRARTRAYEFIAEQLGVPEPEVHLSKITDVELLRRFWRAARATNAQAIRDWARKRGGAKHPKTYDGGPTSPA